MRFLRLQFKPKPKAKFSRPYQLTPRILFILSVLSEVVLACTPLPGSNVTANNRKIVMMYGAVAITAVLFTFVIYFVRGKKGLPLIFASLFFGFFHPFWHFDGGGGDCGKTFAEMARYITIILLGLLGLQIAFWRLRKSKFETSHT